MDRYRVKPGQTINLANQPPDDKSLFPGTKKEGKQQVKLLNDKLEILQELLYAENKHKILIVLQGTDTSGKDGVIRHVFDGVNPQGVSVASFKRPTDEELAHDYLWRVHAHTPACGEIVIFNRSHYEDVLAVRIHQLVPQEIWSKRYEHICQFEKLLTDEGTTIRKFFLHISKDEQKERLQERLDIPEKNWKFNVGDLKERQRWDEYQAAYEDMLNKTSTEYAPWYVIPANKKWYRNLTIASILVDTLSQLDMQLPKAEDDLENIIIE